MAKKVEIFTLSEKRRLVKYFNSNETSAMAVIIFDAVERVQAFNVPVDYVKTTLAEQLGDKMLALIRIHKMNTKVIKGRRIIFFAERIAEGLLNPSE